MRTATSAYFAKYFYFWKLHFHFCPKILKVCSCLPVYFILYFINVFNCFLLLFFWKTNKKASKSLHSQIPWGFRLRSFLVIYFRSTQIFLLDVVSLGLKASADSQVYYGWSAEKFDKTALKVSLPLEITVLIPLYSLMSRFKC